MEISPLFDEYELVSVSVSGDISLFDEYELVSVSVSVSGDMGMLFSCHGDYLPSSTGAVVVRAARD